MRMHYGIYYSLSPFNLCISILIHYFRVEVFFVFPFVGWTYFTSVIFITTYFFPGTPDDFHIFGFCIQHNR